MPERHRARRAFTLLALAITVSSSLVPAGDAAALTTANLVGNPGAEQGAASSDGVAVVPIPQWTTTSNFNVVRYGAPDFPTVQESNRIGGGNNFLAGGPDAANSSATQTIDVTAYANDITRGGESVQLSAYLGGFASQNDNARVVAEFLNAQGAALDTLSLSPVSPAERGDESVLIRRVAVGSVPAATRSIRITIFASRTDGSYNDGYIDNVDLHFGRPLGGLTQLEGTDGCLMVDDTAGCATYATLQYLRAVAISPDGRNIYVTSRTSSSITTLNRDPATGTVSPLPGRDGCISATGHSGFCSVGRGLSHGLDVEVSPDGNNVYVASLGNDSIQIYARDPATGALTELPGEDGCISKRGTTGCAKGKGLSAPVGLAVSRDGRHLYVVSTTSGSSDASDSIAVFRRDSQTGVLTQPSGKDACFSLTGSGGACRKGRALRDPGSVLVGPGASVYVASLGSSALAVFTRNLDTGVLKQLEGREGCVTSKTDTGGCTKGRVLRRAGSLAMSPDGRNLYVGGRDGSRCSDGTAMERHRHSFPAHPAVSVKGPHAVSGSPLLTAWP